MTILVNDTFTGTNGSAWSGSNWALGRNPSAGGGATIQSNQGRLATGTNGSYSGNDRVARRANITNPQNVDMIFSFSFDATEIYPAAMIRADSVLDTQTGYYLSIDKGTWEVGYIISFSGTSLSPTMNYSYTQGTLYRARFRVLGTSIKAKLWLASTNEPQAWDWEGTDSNISSAGAVGFTAGGGAAAASSFFYLDDVTIHNGTYTHQGWGAPIWS